MALRLGKRVSAGFAELGSAPGVENHAAVHVKVMVGELGFPDAAAGMGWCRGTARYWK
ncbi:MAG: hypothetical protein QXO30_02760 [Candidatus Caldarchaeum sp.]